MPVNIARGPRLRTGSGTARAGDCLSGVVVFMFTGKIVSSNRHVITFRSMGSPCIWWGVQHGHTGEGHRMHAVCAGVPLR